MNKYLANIFTAFHSQFVFSRRTKVLANTISTMISDLTTILDIGCGDGTIDRKLLSLKNGVQITGIDVIKRPYSQIPVTMFDGVSIPFPDQTFDYAMFIDVLHHTSNQIQLLKEALRVSKKGIIIKDHVIQGKISFHMLKIMDWFGNNFHNVTIPFNYLTAQQWNNILLQLNLIEEKRVEKIGLYPFPISIIFERNYHFISLLKKQ